MMEMARPLVYLLKLGHSIKIQLVEWPSPIRFDLKDERLDLWIHREEQFMVTPWGILKTWNRRELLWSCPSVGEFKNLLLQDEELTKLTFWLEGQDRTNSDWWKVFIPATWEDIHKGEFMGDDTLLEKMLEKVETSMDRQCCYPLLLSPTSPSMHANKVSFFSRVFVGNLADVLYSPT